MAALYKKLEERANEAGCELLVQYHSDLFQIKTSLLYDGKDGHVLIHVPMTQKTRSIDFSTFTLYRCLSSKRITSCPM
jgi:hypothetical protein